MKTALLLMVCLAQQPRHASLAQGLARVQELALAAQKDEALALCDQLLARHTGRERAALEYARGVVAGGVQEREPARESFERSRADGAGELRLASMYNLGALALEQGEEFFHKLPEVSGKPPAQGQPPAPDPLPQARQCYLAARERLVERLRAQWNDADTRANLELAQRRLKRLDEIEKQRKEEQQKKDQQQKQDSKNEKSERDKSDQKDKPDPDKPPPDSKGEQPQDPQDKNKDKQDPQKPEQPKPEDQTQPGEQPKPESKDAAQPQLSKEELTRLLDKLQQLEDQAAKLRAQIHKARRVAVKKDW